MFLLAVDFESEYIGLDFYVQRLYEKLDTLFTPSFLIAKKNRGPPLSERQRDYRKRSALVPIGG